MNRQKLLVRSMLCLLACTAAACSNDLDEKKNPVQGEGERISVTATAGMPQGRPSTRLGFEETTDGSNILKVNWRPLNDPRGPETFSVFPGTGKANPSTFTLQSMDASSATFTGEIIPADGSKYYAFYPALPPATPVRASYVPMDLEKNQTGTAPDENLMYMYGSSTYNGDGTLNFNFKYLTAIVKMTLKFPAKASTTLSELNTKPLTRSLSGATISNLSCWSQLSTKASAMLTQDPPNFILEGGNRGFTLTGPFTLSSDASPSTTVYLHFLSDTEQYREIDIFATVGGKNYKGTVSTGTTLIEGGYMYTQTMEMQEYVNP